LDKTQVMVNLSFYGDDFPTGKVSEMLEITPTETYKKGDVIPHRSTNLYRKETSWNLKTDYQDSLDVNNQLKQIISKLCNKTAIINEIKNTFSIESTIFIVVKIEEGNTPAFYLGKDIIKFAANIGAEFDIDMYANPY
jgi:hypothetical protein